jgi:hypothetical protein
MMTSRSNRATLIAEIKTELGMRRKVWKRVTGSQDRFIDPSHQRRYDTLNDLLAVMEAMTSREFEVISARMKQEEPPTLF